ncbi:MFS transporter [Caballeronia calidae]|nr:MFS transporter [Caballeronia calidae]
MESSRNFEAMETKAVVSTVIGNMLEWFDFSSYAFFATILARLYFPTGDASTALIAAFAVFGIGLVARPLGAIFFGRLGDIKGRKFALMISMPMIGFATLAIALMPTYEQIGVWAPVCLVICRLAQGFSAGGETGNVIAFLVEWAPQNRRGLYGSFSNASSVSGNFIGSLLAAALASGLSPASLVSWGWRVPFLIGGLVIAPLGFYLRKNVAETPIFEGAVVDRGSAVRVHRTSVWTRGFKTACITSVQVVAFYTFLIYVPSFLTVHGKISASTALWMNSGALFVQIVCILGAGRLSDLVGRKPLLLAASFVVLLLSYPVFSLFVASASVPLVTLGVIASGAVCGVLSGVCPTTMAELFPTYLRTTGMSIGFGLTTAIFGGFASLASETLIKLTGSFSSPSYYVIGTSIISIAGLLSIRETAHSALE